MNTKKNILADFIEKNTFITLLAVSVTVVGATYMIIDKLIIAHYMLKIESLEYVNTENEETIFELKKDIIKKDIEIDMLMRKVEIASKDRINIIKPADTRIKELEQLISKGERISKKEISKNETSLDFLEWKRECIAIISSITSSESLLAKFNQTTDLTDSNYPRIPEMIQKGIDLLENLKGNIK